MKRCIHRYFILFLVFWLGMSLHDTWGSIRAWIHNDDDIALINDAIARNNDAIARNNKAIERTNSAIELIQLEAKITEHAVKKNLIDLKKWQLSACNSTITLAEAADYIPGLNAKGIIAQSQDQVGKLQKEIAKAEKEVEQAEKEIASARRECNEIEKESYRLKTEVSTGQNGNEAKSSDRGFRKVVKTMLNALKGNAAPAVGIVCVAFMGILLFRLFCYYVVAPAIGHCDPINPCGNLEKEPHTGAENEKSRKLINIYLKPGESLLVRDESYTGGYIDHKSGAMKKETQWIFSHRYWLMSWLSGLCILTRFTNPATGAHTHEISITSDDPDEYFSIFTMAPGQKCFITPSDLVAFTDGLRISARWNVYPPAWCMGQIRYYVLSGSGTVVVRAEGGVTARNLASDEIAVRKKHSLICATQGVTQHVRRTETLIPFLLGNASLFDLKLEGAGAFHIRNAITRPHTLIERASHVFLESLGKFLGF